MSLCMPEYDFISNRNFSQEFLYSTLFSTYHTNDKKLENELTDFNVTLNNIQRASFILFSEEKYSAEKVFFNSTFRSLQQVWILLNLTQTLEEFIKYCSYSLSFVTGSGDVYADMLEIRKLILFEGSQMKKNVMH